MTAPYYLDADKVPANLRGGYTGRQFKAVICTSMTPSGMQWNGGSRTTYVAHNLKTGEVREIVDRRSFPHNQGPVPSVDIEPDWCIIGHSMFRGKDMGLTFYLRPENAMPALPEPDGLDDDMRIVLVATRSLKNSYGGRTGIRRAEAIRETGITGEAYDAALARCIDGKLLRKNGSITPAGRNAAGAYTQLNTLSPMPGAIVHEVC